MKYLSQYTEERLSKLFDDSGAFWAFSDARFDEKKNPNLQKSDYCSMLGGLCVPKANAKKVLEEVAKIHKSGIEQDIKENGIIAIIKRELNNHEAYYTQDISSTVDALDAYGLNHNQVYRVFKNQNTTEQDIINIK